LRQHHGDRKRGLGLRLQEGFGVVDKMERRSRERPDIGGMRLVEQRRHLAEHRAWLGHE
jgi:hypothetical protein